MRIIKPFLFLPRNGGPVDPEDGVRDYRPANIVQPERAVVTQAKDPQGEDESSPKVSSVTEPAQGSESDTGENPTPDSDKSPTTTSQSGSAETPASAEKANLLSPPPASPGKTKPPVAE